MNSRLLFALGLFFCLTPWASPPLALLAGLIFGAISTHPYKSRITERFPKYCSSRPSWGWALG